MLLVNMEQETIQISKKEYEKLKRESQVDLELVEKFKRAMEDLKHGRVTEWKSKSR